MCSFSCVKIISLCTWKYTIIPLWMNPRRSLAGLKCGYSSVELFLIFIKSKWKKSFPCNKIYLKADILRDTNVPQLFPHVVQCFMNRIYSGMVRWYRISWICRNTMILQHKQLQNLRLTLLTLFPVSCFIFFRNFW